MNDRRPSPSGLDDGFERALRAALRDTTSPSAPASLSTALAAVVSGPAPARSIGWRRLATTLVAAGLAIAVVSLYLGPASSFLRGVVQPGASPSSTPHLAIASTMPASGAPSGSPIASTAQAYDWSSALVELTADDIILTAGGAPIPASREMTGSSDPGDQSLRHWELEWTADGRDQRLFLDLRADASDWWVQELRMYDDQAPNPDWITFAGPLFRTPIGKAFHGDIALRSDNGRVPGSVTMTNATIDPAGLGTGPHTWQGCTRYATLDAADKDSLQAAFDVTRMDQLARATNVCILYQWSYLAEDGEPLTEVWCTPPPSGSIRTIRKGASGELIVYVDDTVRRQARPQPLEGWGCAGPLPSDAPTVSPLSTTGYDWSGAGASLTADAIILAAGGGPREQRLIAHVPTTLAPTRRHVAAGVDELRWDWISDDRKRLVMRISSDGSRWQVDSVGYQDQMLSDTLRQWTSTPISGVVGQAWSGDLVLSPADAKGDTGSIRMSGLTLDPGVTAAILDAPAPATPFPDRPFVIDDGRVRLAADGLEIEVAGDALHGPTGATGAQPPGTSPRRDTLHANWFDGDRFVQLQFEFRNDGQRWWVSDAWVSATGFDWAPIPTDALTAPLGTAYTGDLTLSLPQMNPGRDNGATGATVHLTIRNLSLEPFRGP